MAKQVTYVEVDGPTTGDFGPEFPRQAMFLVGDRVVVTVGLDFGKRGRITGYGRGRKVDERFRESGDETELIDGEGPIVTFDDRSVEWFCGQATSMLAYTSEVPIYTPDAKAGGKLSDQDKLAIPLTIQQWQAIKEWLNDHPDANAERRTDSEKFYYDMFALIDDELERYGWLS